MFCKKKPTSCTTLNEKRQGILQGFLTAKDQLLTLIAEQESYDAELQSQIKDLQAEQACNNQDVKTSKSILSKIENLLS